MSSKIIINQSNQYSEILTPEAKEFLVVLHDKFNSRRLELLETRKEQQKKFDNGEFPIFPKETQSIREDNWVAATIPAALQDRRVEITGPVDRKMVINALNSGAKMFMTDFEDANSPTWDNNMQGHINLIDAVNRKISLEDKKRGKSYQLNEKIACLLVRPRGLHLNEKNILVNGEITSGSLTDFALYLFHNAKQSIANGEGPFYYLPKLEHYTEARWWNDVFVFAQDYLGLPQGTIKATVLIETITASFQLDEIIYELKEHMAGLNCGRWDYIFSYIKKFRNHKGFNVPDRSKITMTSPFMSAYSQRLIQVCHKRNVFAMGGMAAVIPVKGNEEANKVAFDKVKNDKLREVKNGHDGTWVAHPDLVKVAMDVFNEFMPTPNQLHNKREDVNVSEKDLVEMPEGTITEHGVRENINVGILYIESWLQGRGAAALYNLMEDAATAEISRAQLWLWINKGSKMEDGITIDLALYEKLKAEELIKIEQYVGSDYYKNGKFKIAIDLFDKFIKAKEFDEFLTTTTYELV